MSLSEQQLAAITAAERATSILSVIGTTIIIATFLSSRDFRKPINRVVFYAAWANILTNVGTLISRSAIVAGAKGITLCRFQAFIIQWFMPSDALWTFAMAFNVYLTFLHKYDASNLRSLEWKYAVLCYGLPFIPPFVYFFVNSSSKGPVYGSATLWCWVSVKWDILRIAVFYGPVWLVILLTFTIYARVGYEISVKRRLLRSFNNKAHLMMDDRLNKLFEIHASKVVHITTEAASDQNCNNDHMSTSAEAAYPAYSVTVEGGEDVPIPPSTISEEGNPSFQLPSTSRRLPRIEVSSAAFAYFKYAMLYFIALLVTWVPSTVNRVYSLVHPNEANFGLEFVSAFVLPLQGFWNSIIYMAVSWSTVVDLVRRLRIRHRQQSPDEGSVAIVLKQYAVKTNTHQIRKTAGESGSQVHIHDAASEDTGSTTHFVMDCAGVIEKI